MSDGCPLGYLSFCLGVKLGPGSREKGIKEMQTGHPFNKNFNLLLTIDLGWLKRCMPLSHCGQKLIAYISQVCQKFVK